MTNPRFGFISDVSTLAKIGVACMSFSLVAWAGFQSGTETPEQGADAASAVTVKIHPNDPKADPADAPSEKIPSMVLLNMPAARVEVLLTGLEAPWAFEFLDQNEVIITEIKGHLSRFNLQSAVLTPIDGLPALATDKEQTGLLDVAIHPHFQNNRRIYFSYSVSDEETGRFYQTVVATAILNENKLSDVREILLAGPFGWSPSNFGGALAFDSKGYLFVSIGDRSEHIFAQVGDRLQGKILRLNDDGTVPPDNPFVGNPEVDDRIYALGVRNPQGLYFDRETGSLFEAEHGPMGGDEVNIIVAGANYGWPVITYGKNYTSASIGEGTHKTGMEQPIYYYTPSEGISPIAMYRGAMFPEWEGDLLVGALRGHHISKLDLDGTIVRSEHAMLFELDDRIRDIKVAADGSVYILGETGTLSRLYRDPAAEPAEDSLEDSVAYQLICAGCHDTGANKAPILAVKSQWENILKQPLELSYKHTIEGYKAMPERGLCAICTDQDLKNLVDYMLREVSSPASEKTE